MPNVVELMTTENKIEIRHLSMFIRKGIDIRIFIIFFIKYAPLALSFFYIADVLMCNYIYITCVYFVYCMYTERHFCPWYYRVNS